MHKNLTSLVLLFGLLGNGLIAYLVFARGMSHLYDEGDVLESLQASLLALGGLVFLAVALLAEKRFRLAFLSCFLLCLTFLLREVDVQDYQLPRLLVLMGSGMGRNLLLLSAWLALAIGMALDFRTELRTFRVCLLSQPGFFMIAGGFFVVAGSIFDSQLVSLSHYAFYEELAELNGHFLILQSSLAACWGLKGMPVGDHQQLEPHLT